MKAGNIPVTVYGNSAV